MRPEGTLAGHDRADPVSWNALTPLGHKHAGSKAGLAFWLICDDQKARLFQGVLSRDRRGKKYDEISWRLGMLEPNRNTAAARRD